MGFSNSVAIAQHVHRNIVASSGEGGWGTLPGSGELRRDRAVSAGKNLHGVYLDNFDQLEITDPHTAGLIKGTVSDETLALRHTYEQWGVPRHPKKAVQRQVRAEVQGALVMGDLGIVVPKPQKVCQYLCLGLELLQRGRCSLKQLQIVCGGFVYIALFSSLFFKPSLAFHAGFEELSTCCQVANSVSCDAGDLPFPLFDTFGPDEFPSSYGGRSDLQ